MIVVCFSLAVPCLQFVIVVLLIILTYYFWFATCVALGKAGLVAGLLRPSGHPSVCPLGTL